MSGLASNIIKERSFDHNSSVYDVVAFRDAGSSRTLIVEVSRNGKAVNYSYPDGIHVNQSHRILLNEDLSDVRIENLNALDYAMDSAEALVRCWVA